MNNERIVEVNRNLAGVNNEDLKVELYENNDLKAYIKGLTVEFKYLIEFLAGDFVLSNDELESLSYGELEEAKENLEEMKDFISNAITNDLKANNITPNKDNIFVIEGIEAYEQEKYYGRDIVLSVKENYDIIGIYAIEGSEGFWEKQGFKPIENFSPYMYWMKNNMNLK